MFTPEFCALLEYALTKALAASEDPTLRRYWCDGVLEPEWEDEYRPEHVARSRRIVLRAWMDSGRTKGAPATQQLHPLHLVLGPASLRAYKNGEELQPWIADGIDPAAVGLDATAKTPTFLLHLP